MRKLSISTAALLAASGLSAHAGDFDKALAASKPIIESSLRFEDVDQTGIANKADAVTWRNRIGWQTGAFHNWSLLVEIENTTPLTDAYNSTVNGRTRYPSVNDPQVTELNRGQLTWAPTKTTALVIGRQRITLDDTRFVGNSGWRQDEQTFDAVRFDTGKGKFHLTTAYIAKVNRVTGDEKDWNSDSYLVNASYDAGPKLKLTGFSYGLRFKSAAFAPVAADLANARASSVDIAGVRAAGGKKSATSGIGYILQYAVETPGHGNPQSFRLEEKMAEVNGFFGIWSGRLSYESLGGNGVVGLITPIASGHTFQGYADAFSATGGNKTFADGLNDMAVTVAAAPKMTFKPVFTLVYHDFSTPYHARHLATEWDAIAVFNLTQKLSLMLKRADFEGEPTAPASRVKNWIMLQYKL